MGFMTKTQAAVTVSIATDKVMRLLESGRFNDEPSLEAIREYFGFYDTICDCCDRFPDIPRPPRIARHDKLRALIAT